MLAPWLLRAGALLGVLTFFMPQESGPNGPPRNPLSEAAQRLREAEPGTGIVTASWFVFPSLGCLLALLGSFAGSRRASGWTLTAFLLARAFELATMGSLLATMPGEEGPRGPTRSTGENELSITFLLFVVPLATAAATISRVLGGKGTRSASTFASGGIGLLLLSESVYAVFSPYGPARGPGAFVSLAAASLLLAGAALARTPAAAPAALPAGAP